MKSFEQVLPRLVDSYEKGILVPFLGAGMSVGTCPAWNDLLNALDDSRSEGSSPGTDDPGRRANRIRNRMSRPRNEKPTFADRLREVLYTKGAKFPLQSSALTELWWPLILTTNYDDLLLKGYRAQARNDQVAKQFDPPIHEKTLDEDLLEILGRSRRDCQRLLSSLTTPTLKPTVWALHGYLPERKGEKEHRLASEIILGHAEYRRMAHASVHYRRAFAEVYRSRSLFFLGSSLNDVYLLDLFAEVHELYGPSREPHFALLPEGQGDEHFLRTRFNIHAVRLEDYDRLPKRLHELKKEVNEKNVVTRIGAWTVPTPRTLQSRPTLTIDFAPAGEPVLDDEGLILSASRDRTGFYVSGQDGDRPTGAMAAAVLWDLALREGDKSAYKESGHLRRRTDGASMLAFGVPWEKAHPSIPEGKRDIRVIGSAATEGFEWASSRGMRLLRMALLGAGESRHFPAYFSLVEIVRAYGRFCRNAQSTVPDLTIHVIDTSVQRLVREGRLDITRLLTSSDTTFWVEVKADTEEYDVSEPALYPDGTTIEQLCSDLDIDVDTYGAEVEPLTFTGSKRQRLADVKEQTLHEAGIFPGSLVKFTPMTKH